LVERVADVAESGLRHDVDIRLCRTADKLYAVICLSRPCPFVKRHGVMENE
jgi:hypothetical protein